MDESHTFEKTEEKQENLSHFVVSVLNSSSQNCQDVEFDETYNVNSSQYLH